MKHYYCDECIAKMVGDKKVRTVFEIFPIDKALFKKGVVCYACKKQGTEYEVFWEHPDMDKIYVLKEPTTMKDMIDRGCITIVGDSKLYGMYYRGDPQELLTKQEARAYGAVVNTIKVISMPLCEIAKKLGVPAIPKEQELTTGVYLSDEDGNSYNWPELVYRMTEKMSEIERN